MSKFTAGPWHVFIDDTGGQWSGWPISIGCSDEDKSIVRPGGFYPYEWDSATSQREAVANARLISAAPELLEACRYIVEAGESGDEVKAIEMASAAIAKAIGGEK